MIVCYGVVPLHRTLTGWSVLLVLHRKGHWGLPKGHPNHEQEYPIEVAQRELKEETHLDIEQWIDHISPFMEHYSVDGSTKQVIYFAALVKGEIAIQESEIEAARWFSLQDAIEIATFDNHKMLLKQVSNSLTES